MENFTSINKLKWIHAFVRRLFAHILITTKLNVNNTLFLIIKETIYFDDK